MKLFIGACRLCRERRTSAPPHFSALGSECVHTCTCTYTHVQMSAEQEFLSVSCLQSHPDRRWGYQRNGKCTYCVFQQWVIYWLVLHISGWVISLITLWNGVFPAISLNKDVTAISDLSLSNVNFWDPKEQCHLSAATSHPTPPPP